MKQVKSFKTYAVRFKRFSHKSYSIFNSMHRVVNIGVVAFTMLAFAHTGKVIAQNTNIVKVGDGMELDNDLDEIVVTASQVTLPPGQSAKQVIIIGQKEIEQSAIQSIQDLLNYSSTIDVQLRGIHGVQADISMRGGTADQTTILLNGINLSNPQTGHYSFDIPVNLSDIDHIEIINGPSSLSYGVNAFSGGINIITKKKADEKLFLRAQYGEHSLMNIETSSSRKIKNYTTRLSTSYAQSDGYINNSDYKLFNLLWQNNIAVENAKIEVLFGLNNKQYGANTFYSPSYPDQYDKTQSYFTSIKGETGDKLKFIPSIYWSRHYDEFQLFRDGSIDIPEWYKGHNYHRSDVYGMDLKMQYQSILGISTIRTELRNEGILSNVLGKDSDSHRGKYSKFDNRTNISYIAEQSFIFQKLTLTAGVLANYNTHVQDGFKLYPSINFSYWLTDDIKTYLSWNKATRIPTFTDLYYTSVTHMGNKNLKAEDSESFELGINYKTKWISSHISTFWMQGTNLIDWIKYTQEDEQWTAQNLNTINKIGLDVGFRLSFESIFPQLKQTYLGVGYTRLNQTKKSDFVSNKVLNYLRDKLTLQFNHIFYKNLSASWNFRWQKRMGSYLKYKDLKPTKEQSYPSYSTLDLRLTYYLNAVNITLDFNNIFDQHYYDLGNIMQPGFWMIGGISYTLK